MENERFFALFNKYAPNRLADVIEWMGGLSEALGETGADLRQAMMTAQQRNDFAGAREILDLQEELAQRSATLEALLAGSDPHSRISGNAGDHQCTYDISTVRVKFRKPTAFSFRGNVYPATTWKAILQKVCDLLFDENPDIIRNLVKDGAARIKLSMDEKSLRNPIEIAHSGIWIETNLSAPDIRDSVLALLDQYGIDSHAIYVDLRGEQTEISPLP